ncbi:MAG: redoxin domain-containing protein [Aeoliella sp.]
MLLANCREKLISRFATPATLLLAMGACDMAFAASPTAKQALSLKPIQAGIRFDQPTASEAGECTIKPEKVSGKTAWVIRNGQGEILRRFSDSNGDNVVDTWSYFENGLEVYRDVDADFNGKADQYRWFHTAGTRWGLDENENGKIDSWKQISPYEVAEVAVEAIQRGDANLYRTLLPTSDDIESLGLGRTANDQVAKDVLQAAKEFAKFAVKQRVVNKSTQFLDFGASRPSSVPSGIDGSTKDLVVYENVAALVENSDKPEQVYLGAMVQVGDTWRLLGLPQIGDSPTTSSPFTMAGSSDITPGGDVSVPSDEMQELMAELEKLDRKTGGDRKEQIAVTEKRANILAQLAELSAAGEEREQWRRQQADMLSAAAQTLQHFAAIDELAKLITQLKREKASEELQAHVEFRKMWAEYGKAQFDPKADYAKVQEAWLESLEEFAEDHPRKPDTAEALLQLGMAKEFAGEEEDAVQWYSKLAKNFASTDAGKKAIGAMRRLDSIGKPWRLAGNTIGGGKVDLANYRRKYVLVHYWATWCEPCKEDMKDLVELHAEYSRKGFAIIGVNLDTSGGRAQQFLSKEKLPWKHLYDEGGLDGPLANDMGVMTLPLMLLVDDKGQVVNRNVHVAELETELKRVLR